MYFSAPLYYCKGQEAISHTQAPLILREQTFWTLDKPGEVKKATGLQVLKWCQWLCDTRDQETWASASPSGHRICCCLFLMFLAAQDQRVDISVPVCVHYQLLIGVRTQRGQVFFFDCSRADRNLKSINLICVWGSDPHRAFLTRNVFSGICDRFRRWRGDEDKKSSLYHFILLL